MSRRPLLTHTPPRIHAHTHTLYLNVLRIRHGGRPFDQQLAVHAPNVLPPRRSLHGTSARTHTHGEGGTDQADGAVQTLTWTCTLDWVDSANGPFLHNGLTAFGEEVVREMNRCDSRVSSFLFLFFFSFPSPPTLQCNVGWACWWTSPTCRRLSCTPPSTSPPPPYVCSFSRRRPATRKFSHPSSPSPSTCHSSPSTAAADHLQPQQRPSAL